MKAVVSSFFNHVNSGKLSREYLENLPTSLILKLKLMLAFARFDSSALIEDCSNLEGDSDDFDYEEEKEKSIHILKRVLLQIEDSNRPQDTNSSPSLFDFDALSFSEILKTIDARQAKGFAHEIFKTVFAAEESEIFEKHYDNHISAEYLIAEKARNIDLIRTLDEGKDDPGVLVMNFTEFSRDGDKFGSFTDKFYTDENVFGKFEAKLEEYGLTDANINKFFKLDYSRLESQKWHRCFHFLNVDEYEMVDRKRRDRVNFDTKNVNSERDLSLQDRLAVKFPFLFIIPLPSFP